MSEEQQIEALEKQIREREAQRAYYRARERRRAFWLGQVAPVMGLLLLVALLLMFSQCSSVRIG